jgi:F-type H+-transporting ATPase subunit a
MRAVFLRFLFSLALLSGVSGTAVFAQHEAPHGDVHGTEAPEEFNAGKTIFGHISDAHEWHFFTAGETHATVPLPVILYSPQRGFTAFSAARFGHEGHREAYDGYRLVDEGFKKELTAAGVDPTVAEAIKQDKIVAVDAEGRIDESVKLIDFSITKNVVSMLLSVVLLLVIMSAVARKYKRGIGTKSAPTGFQNALEVAVLFVRDEVAKPNIGNKYLRYMPLLLTVFFFIWINNMLGLFPGGANFTGNIAVTGALALISFIVMIFSGNKHFWSHLLNPPGVPLPVKFILVPIEIISLFIKPIALTIRLFANILAGHIIILAIISMIFIFGKLGASPGAGFGFSIVSIAFSIFMFCLELLVAAIQAFIFTNLTAVFIGQAVEEAHHHDHHTEDYHAHNPETGQKYNVGTQEIIA